MKPNWWLLQSQPKGHSPGPGPGPGPILPELVVLGQFLALENGTYWTAIQCSDFNLLNRFQNNEMIEPILKQRADCGFNLLRVWTLFDIPGIGTCKSVDYERIPIFIQLCASYGLRVEFTAYTGINDPQHWSRLCNAALQSQPRPLLELVNELDQNTNEQDFDVRVFNLKNYSKPVGILASHGSNGAETRPVEPFWDYATFHTNGAFEEQRKVGHNAWEIWGGPTLTNETSRFPEVGMWPGSDENRVQQLAYDSAAGAALLCAGSCFHSVGGKTSSLWSSDEETAAKAWTTGAASVDLRAQDGRYNHAANLEGPNDLRVYQRILNNGEVFTVRIRK